MAQLLRAAAGVEQLDGCGLYVVNTSLSEPDVVWVTEMWDSEEEHRVSLSLPGMPELIQETLPLLAGPPEQIRLTPLGGKGLT